MVYGCKQAGKQAYIYTHMCNSKSVQLYSFYTGHLDRMTSEEVAWKLVIGDMRGDSNY